DGLVLANGALLDQVLDRDVAALGEQFRDLVQVHDLVLDAERVLEAAQLRQAHVQRQLPACEAGLDLVTGLSALGAAASGLALGRLAATHAGLGGLGAFGRAQVVYLECLFDLGHAYFASSTFTRCGTLLTMPTVTGSASRTTVWPIRFNPSERRVSRWFCLPPMTDLVWVIASFALLGTMFFATAYAPAFWLIVRSIWAGTTSSIGRPRRAATDAGSSSAFKAATVPWTMLIWLAEPMDFESTSWMPAHSRTARTGPPAITPVPGEAGRSSTTPAAASPCTRCGMVEPTRGTRKKDFFASSTPLAMAAGTSLALP